MDTDTWTKVQRAKVSGSAGQQFVYIVHCVVIYYITNAFVIYCSIVETSIPEVPEVVLKPCIEVKEMVREVKG